MNQPNDPIHDDSSQPEGRDENVPAGGDAESNLPFGAEASDGSPGSRVAELEARLAELEATNAELSDRLLRTQADYQNYIRRASQSEAAARTYAIRDVCRSLVTVLDHFDHAMNVDVTASSAQSVIQGVEIVRQELLKTLTQFGVERVDAQPGEPFDPSRHEALMRQPVAGLEPDLVADQMQPGYVLDNVTLRPAKVSVTA